MRLVCTLAPRARLLCAYAKNVLVVKHEDSSIHSWARGYSKPLLGSTIELLSPNVVLRAEMVLIADIRDPPDGEFAEST